MKRTMCGGFLLAGLILSSACSGDPTGDILGSGITLQPSPSSLFLAQGEQEALTVSVVDAQGNEQDITGFSFEGGAGITVTEDTTYLRTNAGGQLGTSKRLFVDGVSATASQLTITANGQTSTVPVRVTPIGTTVTLSTAAPAANEGLIITLPAGYKFGAGGGASVDGAPGITTAVAPDSTSATVLLPPGTTGTIQVDSVAVDFVPGVLFSLPTTETVTVGPASALPGTDSPATAPALAIPAPGGASGLFDAPDFAASASRFYRLDIPEAGDYDITLNWDLGSDMDMYLCLEVTCTDVDFQAGTTAQPEHGVYTFEGPTTAYLWILDYNGDAAGATISLALHR